MYFAAFFAFSFVNMAAASFLDLAEQADSALAPPVVPPPTVPLCCSGISAATSSPYPGISASPSSGPHPSIPAPPIPPSSSAGILPFSFTGSRAVVLLGAERFGRRVRWCDFGGRAEASDEDTIATASREFAEESLGLFGGTSVDELAVASSAALMASSLRRARADETSLRVEAPVPSFPGREQSTYTLFVAPVPYVDAFALSLASEWAEGAGGVRGGMEKVDFAWVSADALVRAVAARGERSPRSSICLPGVAVEGFGRRPLRRLHLHPRVADCVSLAIKVSLPRAVLPIALVSIFPALLTSCVPVSVFQGGFASIPASRCGDEGRWWPSTYGRCRLQSRTPPPETEERGLSDVHEFEPGQRRILARRAASGWRS